MKPMKTLLAPFVLLLLLSLACGQLSVGIEQPTPEVNDAPPILEEEAEPTGGSQTKPEVVRTEPEEEDFSEFWVEVEDYRTGVRFAIPCFWVANVPAPEQDPTGLGSFSVENFTQDFVSSLGPKQGQQVFEIGGVKFDLGYIHPSEYNLPFDGTLEELANAVVNPDAEHGITSTAPISFKGLTALEVQTFSIFGEGQFTLIPYAEDLVIMFAPSQTDHPDIQAILHSFTLSPIEELVKPTQKPADPPEGMSAPCIGKMTAGEPDETPLAGTLDCAQVTDADGLMWVMCNVQDSFISRNTQPLLGYMSDTFKIGYWQSQGIDRSKEDAFNEIVNTHMPMMGGGMSFTTDENLFPPLFGQPPENMFGPEDKPAAIVYSEGWGQAGQGAALLYFAEDPDGGYSFYAMVIAPQHFDK